MLTSDFTFSSPRDDHIDRDQYFKHCWPKEKVFRAIHIEHLVPDRDEVIVGYRAEKMDGGSFRNVEMIRFTGDRIAEVNVYFGRNVWRRRASPRAGPFTRLMPSRGRGA